MTKSVEVVKISRQRRNRHRYAELGFYIADDPDAFGVKTVMLPVASNAI